MSAASPRKRGELDLNEVVRLVRGADVLAFVGHSGGGNATIYAGERHPDEHGEPLWTACAGPGEFLPDPETGRHWAFGRASLSDFHIGPEGDDAPALSATEIGITTETEAAAVIVAQAMRRGLLTLADARAARDVARSRPA